MNEDPLGGQPAYPPRITTFIDILGFSRDVRNLEHRPQLLLPIEAVLRHIANCKRNIDDARGTGTARHDARMTHFSDCVVLSYRPAPDAAARALWDAAFLGQVMLRAGFLPRGAITIGRLWHDDSSVFGQALLDAYEAEQKRAITPRILVGGQLMQLASRFFNEHPGPESEQSCVRDDGDGRYLHALSKDWSFLHKERAEEQAGKYEFSGIQQMFEELQRMLPLRFQEATAREKVKLEWMRDYINRAIEEHELPVTFRVTLPSA